MLWYLVCSCFRTENTTTGKKRKTKTTITRKRRRVVRWNRREKLRQMENKRGKKLHQSLRVSIWCVVTALWGFFYIYIFPTSCWFTWCLSFFCFFLLRFRRLSTFVIIFILRGSWNTQKHDGRRSLDWDEDRPGSTAGTCHLYIHETWCWVTPLPISTQVIQLYKFL